MKRKTYPGSLNEPIFLDVGRWPREFKTGNVSVFVPLRDHKYRERIIGQVDGKIELLFEHYEINLDAHDKWKRLARHLITDHVPGFRFSHTKPKRLRNTNQN